MSTTTATPTLPSAELLRQRDGSKIYILALARAIPLLEPKVRGWTPQNWDIDRFMEASGPWSSGEKVCARFIATVWNPTYAQTNGWQCDVTDVASSVNFEDKLVMLHWIAKPVYP